MLQYYITGKIHIEVVLEMLPLAPPAAAIAQRRDSSSQAAPLSGAHRGSGTGSGLASAASSSTSPPVTGSGSSGSGSGSSPLSQSVDGFTLISND